MPKKVGIENQQKWENQKHNGRKGSIFLYKKPAAPYLGKYLILVDLGLDTPDKPRHCVLYYCFNPWMYSVSVFHSDLKCQQGESLKFAGYPGTPKMHSMKLWKTQLVEGRKKKIQNHGPGVRNHADWTGLLGEAEVRLEPLGEGQDPVQGIMVCFSHCPLHNDKP